MIFAISVGLENEASPVVPMRTGVEIYRGMSAEAYTRKKPACVIVNDKQFEQTHDAPAIYCFAPVSNRVRGSLHVPG